MISLLRHSIEVIVDVAGGVLDPDGEDRGHLATTELVIGPFRGLVQPRSARERASVASADVSIGSHRVYLERAAIGAVDSDMRLRKVGDPDPDLNGTYRIEGEVANAAGMGHHLEVAAERVDA